jgi:membrane protein
MGKFIQKVMSFKPLNDFMTFYKASEMNLSSIAVAYYLLLSLFPLLMVLGNLLPYLNLDIPEILKFLDENLPKSLYSVVASIVKSTLSDPNPSLLGIAIATGTWTIMKALTALQQAFNKAYEVSHHRDFILSQFFSILASLAIVGLLLLATALSTFGQVALETIHEHFKFDQGIYNSLHNMRMPVVVAVVFAALLVLYFSLPNVRLHKVRYVVPGTIFSTFVLVFLTNFIGQYVSRQTDRLLDFKVVGSIVIFALMIWFIFLARVLIIGAVINAVYLKHHEKHIETRRGEIITIIMDRVNDKKTEGDL